MVWGDIIPAAGRGHDRELPPELGSLAVSQEGCTLSCLCCRFVGHPITPPPHTRVTPARFHFLWGGLGRCLSCHAD